MKRLVPIFLLFFGVSEGKAVGKGDKHHVDLRYEVETFTEAEPIVLGVEGNMSLGYGCSFEISISGVPCCYVEERREDKRGVNLCKESLQPTECPQPRSGRYKVEEHGRDCVLYLYGSNTTNFGKYKVHFPKTEEYGKIFKVIELRKTTSANFLIISISVFSILLILLILLSLLILNNQQKNRKNEKVLNAEDIFEKLTLKEALGKRHIMELRDRNYNNIFHLAPLPHWEFEMTDDDAVSVAPLLHDIYQLKPSTWSRWLWFLNHGVPHPDLNTQNLDGDTPLIIAAEHGQKDKVEALLGIDDVKIDTKNNKKHNALESALLGYLFRAQTSKHNDYLAIVQQLEKKEAKEESDQLELPSGSSVDFASMSKKHKNILDKLVAEKESQDGKEDTVFKLAAGGHHGILETQTNDANTDWDKCIEDCLIRAVQESNLTAVKTICELQKSDFTHFAVEKAVAMANVKVTEYRDIKTAEDIVEELKTRFFDILDQKTAQKGKKWYQFSSS